MITARMLGSIYKALDLPQCRLRSMPLCTQEILRWKESPLEYWAREAVWAFRTLEESGEEITKTKIQKMTNTKNRDYERFKPFLVKFADDEMCQMIVKVMEDL